MLHNWLPTLVTIYDRNRGGESGDCEGGRKVSWGILVCDFWMCTMFWT